MKLSHPIDLIPTSCIQPKIYTCKLRTLEGMNERRRKWILSEKKSLSFFILKAPSEASDAMEVLSGGLFYLG